jgi:hypothetical protein
MLVVVTSPAQASAAEPTLARGIFDYACPASASSAKIVAIYWRGSNNAVLRCGTATWGYRHIDGRTADGFDSEIDTAIYNTVRSGRANPNGTKITYVRAGFVVPVETRTFSDGAMMGIITAYHG